MCVCRFINVKLSHIDDFRCIGNLVKHLRWIVKWTTRTSMSKDKCTTKHPKTRNEMFKFVLQLSFNILPKIEKNI